jgi:uncharacterized protein YndB with AHSA1/START domain
MKDVITVSVIVNATVDKVWNYWTTPQHIMQWNNPSDDWHNLSVEVDLREGGAFLFKMEAKDGSNGFDYCGKYDKVKTNEIIELTTADGRKTINTFTAKENETLITETFEAEQKTPLAIQREFCLGVLNNFKRYVEKNK